MKDALLILLAVLLVLGGTCLIAFPFSLDYGELFDKIEDKKDPSNTDDTDDSDTNDVDPPGDDGSDDTSDDTPSDVEKVNVWIGAETTVSDSEGNSNTYSYENVKLELNKAYTFFPKEQGTYYLDKNFVSQDVEGSSYYGVQGEKVFEFSVSQEVTFAENTSYFLYEVNDLIGIKFVGDMAYDYYTSCLFASGNFGGEICYGTFTSLKNYPVKLSLGFEESVKSVSGSVGIACMSLTDYFDLVGVPSTSDDTESLSAPSCEIEFTPTDFAVIYYVGNRLNLTYKEVLFTIENRTSLDIRFQGNTVSTGDAKVFTCNFGTTDQLFGGSSDEEGIHISIRTDPDDSGTQVAFIDDYDGCEYSFAPEDGAYYYAVEVPY